MGCENCCCILGARLSDTDGSPHIVLQLSLHNTIWLGFHKPKRIRAALMLLARHARGLQANPYHHRGSKVRSGVRPY